MAKLNHAKIIKGFEALRQTTNGEDFFVGFLKTFGFPAATIRNVQDPNNGRNIAIAEGDYGLAKNMYFRPVTRGQDVNAVVKTLVKDATIAKHKVRFIFATDFHRVVAYDSRVDDWADFDFADLVENYEFFLPLTGLYEKPLAYTSHPADVKACEKMGKLYDIIRATNQYDDEHLHDLNVFLTRLLFCFFAEDTGIFPIQGQMTKAIESLTKTDGSDMDNFFERLFWMLDMEPGRFARKQETPTLAAFPYVNGGLFRDKIRIPTFNARARNILLECGRLEWNLISPVIFGSMFQAVMKPEERHALGAHFTSERNIMKVIEPLFLDDLKSELRAILESIKDTQKKLTKEQTDKLYAFQGKLASLTFLDPACGSGNFLIVSFREIKRLEFEAVKALHKFDDTHERSLLDDWKLEASKVTIDQFYGIEIEEFPVEVARVSMWLMEHVMNVEFGKFFGATIPTIPLKDAAHIVCANALTTDWATVVPVERLSYIIGNPPFSGAHSMNKDQKTDMEKVFNGEGLWKSLDYVCGWYKKASLLKNDHLEIAFVSTNSICQGEQVAPLWSQILDRKDIKFAHQNFLWSNEAKDNAAVTCVIVGLVNKSERKDNKRLFVYESSRSEPSLYEVKHINPYLVDGNNVFVNRSNYELSGQKPIRLGNRPLDGQQLIVESEVFEKLKENNDEAIKYIKRFVGSKEFIRGELRYCIWLAEGNYEEFSKNKFINQRLVKCKEVRRSLKDPIVKKLEKTPWLFRDNCNPDTAIVIPRVSSERRIYIPMGFLNKDYIIADACYMVPNGTLYDFGILESRMHMTWMRTVCGRLKSDYRYSRDLCYNTFPWPDAKETQRQTIEVLAQKVLDARDFYPEFTLADLYDPDKMPPELKETHEQLDRAVDQLYCARPFANDEERLHMLFERYEALVSDPTLQPAKKGKKK